jgi:hypothetical protein
MTPVLRYILIFFAELVWSWCAGKVTKELVKGRLYGALSYDFISSLIAYEVLAFLSKGDWSHSEILCAVLGGLVGLGLAVGKRKGKKKAPTGWKKGEFPANV